VIRLEARHSSPAILSNRNLQFNKFVGDAARYIGSGGGSVLALRIRGGTVFGRTFGTATGFVPPQERLYAGGPTTVRGFAQNELGAAIYIADATNASGFRSTPLAPPDSVMLEDTTTSYRRVVPVGGNALVVANLELRLRSPFLSDLLQWTVFTDAGEVWNRGSLGSLKLKVTPGIQLTAFSPVGPIRAAIGYNPYARPAGPLYYEARREGGALVCVSPNNGLGAVVTTAPDGTITDIQQRPDECAQTFKPAADNSFRSRLTFSFAIGQAF
jgi:outer membrane protein assembly factor BamA